MIHRSNCSTLVVAVALVATVALAGCAKAPVQEMEAARLAVTAVLNEGGQQYLGEETKKLQESLEAALGEVTAQDERFYKNYDKAIELLRKVAGDAESTKVAVAARKEELKAKATVDIAAARTAVEEADRALASAPRGKGTTEDLEAMKDEIAAVRDLLAVAEAAAASGDFSGASTHAAAVTQRATAVSDDVAAAIAKVSRARGGKQYHN